MGAACCWLEDGIWPPCFFVPETRSGDTWRWEGNWLSLVPAGVCRSVPRGGRCSARAFWCCNARVRNLYLWRAAGVPRARSLLPLRNFRWWWTDVSVAVRYVLSLSRVKNRNPEPLPKANTTLKLDRCFQLRCRGSSPAFRFFVVVVALASWCFCRIFYLTEFLLPVS